MGPFIQARFSRPAPGRGPASPAAPAARPGRAARAGRAGRAETGGGGAGTRGRAASGARGGAEEAEGAKGWGQRNQEAGIAGGSNNMWAFLVWLFSGQNFGMAFFVLQGILRHLRFPHNGPLGECRDRTGSVATLAHTSAGCFCFVGCQALRRYSSSRFFRRFSGCVCLCQGHPLFLAKGSTRALVVAVLGPDPPPRSQLRPISRPRANLSE